MSFLRRLFKKEKGQSVVLIDIDASSVAGAYVRYTEGEPPTLLYTRRLPIEAHGDEPKSEAMLRALTMLGDSLMREGGPILVRAAGNGNVDSILVSVDAPWQKTSVRTEYFEQNMPFIFNESLVLAALEKTSVVPRGKILADESIVGTILNGYETRDPYGKQAHRASIVVLTSLVDEQVARDIYTIIRSLYHTKNIIYIAGSSLRYQAMRVVFPHEKDALILDAAGSMTSISLVRRDLLIEVIEIRTQEAGTAAWVEELTNEFARLAGRFPLPRTIFLVAREPEIETLREELDRANFGKLWLSDNPPHIVSVLGSHIDNSVRHATTAPLDLSLLLMALYFLHRRIGGMIA